MEGDESKEFEQNAHTITNQNELEQKLNQSITNKYHQINDDGNNQKKNLLKEKYETNEDLKKKRYFLSWFIFICF